MTRDFAIHVRKLKLAHKNRVVEQQRMSDEGVPGSQEPFNVPAFALEYQADALIDLANQIKESAKFLRNTPVDEWK